jgi:hypothetical protein
MDIFVNNAPAQSVPAPQSVPVQGYGPVQGYSSVQGYGAPAYGYGPGPYGNGGHHPGGFGFVLLALVAVFLFLRWNRLGGRFSGARRRRMAMLAGGGPGGGQDAAQGASQEGQGWKPPRMPWMRDNAAEIARERFARGEINAEELAVIMKGLDAD